MNSNARNWRVVIGGVAAGSVALLGLAGTNAAAEPVLPAPPVPAPATVTQTVTAAPSTVTVTPTASPAATSATASPAAAVPTTAAATPTAAATAAAATATPAPATPALAPATTGTLAEFFKEKGVAVEPQKAAGFSALNLVLPMPTGWSTVPDPNVPNAFTVIADRRGGDALYTPNAQLMVAKLVGDFDPREAISHGFVETVSLTAWQSTTASLAEFGGFPSSFIEGTYREGDLTLNTSRRNVIAQAGSDRYLVSLSVTTSANQVVAAAAATDGILKGFRVGVPGAGAPAAPTAAAAALAAAPAPAVAAPAPPAAVPAPAAVAAAPAPVAAAPAAVETAVPAAAPAAIEPAR